MIKPVQTGRYNSKGQLCQWSDLRSTYMPTGFPDKKEVSAFMEGIFQGFFLCSSAGENPYLPGNTPEATAAGSDFMGIALVWYNGSLIGKRMRALNLVENFERLEGGTKHP